MQDMGVALIRPSICQELEAGRLVMPFQHSYRTAKAYHLVRGRKRKTSAWRSATGGRGAASGRRRRNGLRQRRCSGFSGRHQIRHLAVGEIGDQVQGVFALAQGVAVGGSGKPHRPFQRGEAPVVEIGGCAPLRRLGS